MIDRREAMCDWVFAVKCVHHSLDRGLCAEGSGLSVGYGAMQARMVSTTVQFDGAITACVRQSFDCDCDGIRVCSFGRCAGVIQDMLRVCWVRCEHEGLSAQ